MEIDEDLSCLIYYDLKVVIDDEILPEYSGSQLRGGFGYALKKVCCINPSYECNGCFASKQCLYHEFYELKNSVHRYRFLPSHTSPKSEFNLLLFGGATEKLPYILSALKMSIEELGLGAKRVKSKIKNIAIGDKCIYQSGKFDINGVSPARFTPKELGSKLKIELLTPLRLKSNGETIDGSDIDITKLVLSILHKKDELLSKARQRYTIATDAKLIDSNLRFVDTQRYSSSQKTKMNLGGFMGNFLYENVDKKIASILQLGEIIGVGKSCVFGLGEIKLEEVS